MSNFAGMEDLLSDFLIEAGEMLSDVESMLLELEESPGDGKLLNEVFRGFHTIKGGAGFLNASELVSLCHSIENLFDKLRNSELVLSAELMGLIYAATADVRRMFADLQLSEQPSAAPGELIAALQAALSGQKIPVLPVASRPAMRKVEAAPAQPPLASSFAGHDSVDWKKLFGALSSTEFSSQDAVRIGQEKVNAAIYEKAFPEPALGRRATDMPAIDLEWRENDVPETVAGDSTIRVDVDRLDQVMNLSGEIGLTKNRLTHLRSAIIHGRNDVDTMEELDQAISRLDTLAVNLQNAVMKTRMQPIGRLLNKYPRLAGDLARSLGKNAVLVLDGGYIEMDTTMIEDLNEPLVRLLRNAVEHGVESAEDRLAAGKPEKSVVDLRVRQDGEHILITIADDGRGMNPEAIRNKAIERGLITGGMADKFDEKQSLNLVFLPGFASKDGVTGVPGCGAGMDVVRAAIEKLNGTVHIRSAFSKGTVVTIQLPLTQAILPVLNLRLGEQLFAVPLSMVREILSVSAEQLHQVSGRASMVVRGEVLPVLPLAQLIGWEPGDDPGVGVLMQLDNISFIVSADALAGHDEVAIKSMDIFRPKGVAGVAISSDGGLVLILDIKELLSDVRMH